jgi:hypothetical protein
MAVTLCQRIDIGKAVFAAKAGWQSYGNAWQKPTVLGLEIGVDAMVRGLECAVVGF